MKIIVAPISRNDCYQNNVNKVDSRYTTFQKRGPVGLMLHSVGCPQPNAKVFADGWNVSGKDVAVHAVLQADGTVYQCMPWNFRGWHAGGSANDTHIGVEMTEPSCIKYANGGNFTCSDLEAAQEQVRGTYKTAVDLFASFCEEYDLDPMTAIISHAEGAKRGIASSHGDPEHLWRGLDMGYTMDKFRADVKAKLTPAPEPVQPYPKQPFVDVPADAWYGPDVQWAYENGITNGVDATHFSPDSPCTRAQVVTFLRRLAGMLQK